MVAITGRPVRCSRSSAPPIRSANAAASSTMPLFRISPTMKPIATFSFVFGELGLVGGDARSMVVIRSGDGPALLDERDQRAGCRVRDPGRQLGAGVRRRELEQLDVAHLRSADLDRRRGNRLAELRLDEIRDRRRLGDLGVRPREQRAGLQRAELVGGGRALLLDPNERRRRVELRLLGGHEGVDGHERAASARRSGAADARARGIRPQRSSTCEPV